MNINIDDIKKLILKVAETANVEVLDENTDFSEADIDSLEEFNIFLEVEEQYGVAVPDEIADEIRTINQLIEFIKNNK